jgi:hypothetical protein
MKKFASEAIKPASTYLELGRTTGIIKISNVTLGRTVYEGKQDAIRTALAIRHPNPHLDHYLAALWTLIPAGAAWPRKPSVCRDCSITAAGTNLSGTSLFGMR